MQCYTEITYPTAVSHSVNIAFTHSRANNLIVAKTSLLQIFELKHVLTESDPNIDEAVEPSSPDITAQTLNRAFIGTDLAIQKLESTAKLLILAEFPLAGTVASIGRVKLPNTSSGGEALLVAFRDAKVSLIEWDPERYSINTISIHYYENGLPSNPWAPDISQCPCSLSVDPSNRCAVLHFGPRHVAILPFRQADEEFDSHLNEKTDKAGTSKQVNGDLLTSKTPYGSSFVLPLTALDPEILFPIHVKFLHEYREPTFGILYASKAPSTSLTLERRDIVSYKVFMLDLDQRASTTILSVSRLPSGVDRIVPLPLPVGGALLIGCNELIHVDQAGKTTALAVNEFSKQLSSFPMIDQSSLHLRLENCVIESLGDRGDLLIILGTGELVMLGFVMDGRSVAGINLHNVTTTQGGAIGPVGISCSSDMGRGKIFVGSEDNDSLLIGWSRKSDQLTRKRSHADMLREDVELSEDEQESEDEDDIYSVSPKQSKVSSRTNYGPIEPETIIFRVHDRLNNLCPTGEVTFGNKIFNQHDSAVQSPLNLLYPNGRGKTGGLAIASQEIDPVVRQEAKFPCARAAWAFHTQPPDPSGLVPKGHTDSEGLLAADSVYDQHLLVSESSESGENSFLYSTNSGTYTKIDLGDFESEGLTVDLATLANGTRIVQAKSGEIRCYNSDFGLEQILPMLDEETDAELKVVSVSFCDPYMMVLRDDSSLILLEAMVSGDLEEIELGNGILANKWLSGCLYRQSLKDSKAYAFLLTAEGFLRIFELPKLDSAVYSTDAFPYVPGFITDSFVPRRYAAKETLAEILMADLGDGISQSPFLMLRTSLNDLILYQPYQYPSAPKGSSFTTNLRWKKVPQPKLTKAQDLFSDEPAYASGGSMLRYMPNVGGYSTVFQTGNAQSFILRETSSMPKVIKLQGEPMSYLGAYHTSACDRGFVSLDGMGTLRACELPSQTRFCDTGWPTKQITLGQEVTHISYFAPKDLYVIATVEKVEFKLPDDENHKEWDNEDITLRPLADQGFIKLLNPSGWVIIDTLELHQSETCLSMTAATLEVSEKTHEEQSFIAVGTLVATGEDQATRGRVYVLDIINVAPEPGQPETGFKLKIWTKEDMRGAVTALHEIGSQGFLLVAQGQKCLVRGLIEEKKLLPVAFMDVQCYITCVRVLQGTGLFVLGDIAKGLWFAGYMEDPYKMVTFGKSDARMEVVASEFLPQNKQLNILAADAERNIHVLQFDPENAKSSSGRQLIQKSMFHMGHLPVSMHLLTTKLSSTLASTTEPDTDVDMMNGETSSHRKPSPPLQQVLVVTQTGTMALITPVDELTYLRLNAMQTYLNGQLDHACGLNPRSYRAVESERMGIKGVVDGSLIRRWAELPKQRRVEACGRLGTEEALVRQDLDLISGGALQYL